MIAGGIVEAFLGVKAEGQSLESIAQPLTAEDADTGAAGTDAAARARLTDRRGDDMPMPPPKASTEGKRDRQVFHEMGQIVRALEANGPQPPERLAELVGAAYWEHDRFDRALAFVVQDGLAYRTSDGLLAAP